MPPNQVRELQALIAEQQQAIAPQKQLIDADIAANATAGVAQEAGLGAVKDREFRNIGQRSQNKGMFFSGFSPDAEAEYTAGSYLPALAQLQATIASTRSSLLGKKADLDTDVFNRASGMRENDITSARAYQIEQERKQHEASLAEIAWQRSQKEAAAQRSFEASQGAANRAASASKTPAKPTAQQAVLQAFSGAASQGLKIGTKDGKFTENTLVPAIMSEYGMSYEQAKNLVYPIRKQVYGA